MKYGWELQKSFKFYLITKSAWRIDFFRTFNPLTFSTDAILHLVTLAGYNYGRSIANNVDLNRNFSDIAKFIFDLSTIDQNADFEDFQGNYRNFVRLSSLRAKLVFFESSLATFLKDVKAEKNKQNSDLQPETLVYPCFFFTFSKIKT